jgi:hypothetical protein
MPYKHSERYADNKFLAADIAADFQMFLRDPNGATLDAEVGATDFTEILKKFFSPDWGIVLQSGSLTTAIPAQTFGPREVPYAMTLLSCEMVAIPITGETAGDIVVDVWVDTYGNWPPVVGDSIVGAGVKPTISGALKSNDTDLSDWTDLTLAAGSKALFNVVSCSNLCVVAIKFPNVRTA